MSQLIFTWKEASSSPHSIQKCACNSLNPTTRHHQWSSSSVLFKNTTNSLFISRKELACNNYWNTNKYMMHTTTTFCSLPLPFLVCNRITTNQAYDTNYPPGVLLLKLRETNKQNKDLDVKLKPWQQTVEADKWTETHIPHGQVEKKWCSSRHNGASSCDR